MLETAFMQCRSSVCDPQEDKVSFPRLLLTGALHPKTIVCSGVHGCVVSKSHAAGAGCLVQVFQST